MLLGLRSRLPSVLPTQRGSRNRSQPALRRLRLPLRNPLHPHFARQQLPRAHGSALPSRVHEQPLSRYNRRITRRHMGDAAFSFRYRHVGNGGIRWTSVRTNHLRIRSARFGLALQQLGVAYHQWAALPRAVVLLA